MLGEIYFESFVKGFHACDFDASVHDRFIVYCVMGVHGTAFQVRSSKGVLGHQEKRLSDVLVNYKANIV